MHDRLQSTIFERSQNLDRGLFVTEIKFVEIAIFSCFINRGADKISMEYTRFSNELIIFKVKRSLRYRFAREWTEERIFLAIIYLRTILESSQETLYYIIDYTSVFVIRYIIVIFDA